MENKIIWGVSPFEGNSKRHSKTLETVAATYAHLQPVIQPVTLIPAGLFRPTNSRETWHDVASNVAHDLDLKLSSKKISGLQPPRLLRTEGNSTAELVDAMIQFAIDEDASMIVVDSHARKGLERMFLGSFAETLVLQSPLPVMVINPKSEPTSQLKRIFFPTDFSEGSHEVFRRISRLAASLDVPIYLFHKLALARPELGAPFVLPAIARDSIRELKLEFYAKGKTWAQESESQGARVKVHLDTRPGPALDEILRITKKLQGKTLVAMASQSTRLKSLLLGSLTRQILRHSPCPVVVLHAEQENRVKHFLENAENLAYTYTANPLIR